MPLRHLEAGMVKFAGVGNAVSAAIQIDEPDFSVEFDARQKVWTAA